MLHHYRQPSSHECTTHSRNKPLPGPRCCLNPHPWVSGPLCSQTSLHPLNPNSVVFPSLSLSQPHACHYCPRRSAQTIIPHLRLALAIWGPAPCFILHSSHLPLICSLQNQPPSHTRAPGPVRPHPPPAPAAYLCPSPRFIPPQHPAFSNPEKRGSLARRGRRLCWH
jgi:hypothetical protein